MSYRYYAPPGGWKAWHMRRAAAVSRSVGGADGDVLDTFFSLTTAQLRQVFSAYSSRYGSSKASYARKSYNEWRDNQKTISGVTLSRLLDVVPPALPFDVRLELLRKIRTRLLKGRTLKVRILGRSDLAAVDSAARMLIHEAATRDLPDLVRARLTWLSEGDTVVAERLLAESDRVTAELARAQLQREMAHLEDIFRSSDEVVRSARHRIELAGGTIEISFKRRRWWMSSSEKKDESPSPDALVRADQSRNLLEMALAKIEGESGQQLIHAAQREVLRLQVQAHERELRRSMSQAEMDDFITQAIRTVRQIDPKLTKVTATGEWQGGTGRTEIKVESRKCFIATAVYQSPDAPQVVRLRRFRDEQLHSTAYGRLLSLVYDTIGPFLALIASRQPFVSRLAKRALDAFVGRLPETTNRHRRAS